MMLNHKKLFLILIMLILLGSSRVSAYQQGGAGVILGDTMVYMANYLTGDFVDVFGKDYEGNLGLFYPLQPWEFTVCSNDVTTSLNLKQDNANFGQSTDITNIYSAVTQSLSAYIYSNENYDLSGNKYLYEVAWYVQPKDTQITYSVYFIDQAGTKKYVPNYKDVISDPAQGDAGYYADYSNKTYVSAVLECSGCNNQPLAFVNASTIY